MIEKNKLLDEIRAGKKLRPVDQESSQPPGVVLKPVVNTNKLLDEIRAGKKLRPVQTPQPLKSHQSPTSMIIQKRMDKFTYSSSSDTDAANNNNNISDWEENYDPKLKRALISLVTLLGTSETHKNDKRFENELRAINVILTDNNSTQSDLERAKYMIEDLMIKMRSTNYMNPLETSTHLDYKIQKPLSVTAPDEFVNAIEDLIFKQQYESAIENLKAAIKIHNTPRYSDLLKYLVFINKQFRKESETTV